MHIPQKQLVVSFGAIAFSLVTVLLFAGAARGQNDTGLRAFQVQSNKTVTLSVGQAESYTGLSQVPTGKRLVIERITGRITTTLQKITRVRLITFVDASAYGGPGPPTGCVEHYLNIPTPEIEPVGLGLQQTTYNFDLTRRLYADPPTGGPIPCGNALAVSRADKSKKGLIEWHFGFSGYLLDMPPAASQNLPSSPPTLPLKPLVVKPGDALTNGDLAERYDFNIARANSHGPYGPILTLLTRRLE